MTVPHIRLDRRQFYLFEGLGINSHIGIVGGQAETRPDFEDALRKANSLENAHLPESVTWKFVEPLMHKGIMPTWHPQLSAKTTGPAGWLYYQR
jgi:hypothetical protein